MRISIGDGKSNPELSSTHSAEVWKECRRLAIRQGVHALAWDAILRLSPEFRPPRDILLAWGAAVADYENRYEYYCKTAHRFSEFLSSHDIGMFQFKGIGLSSFYPIPAHREGGDIDMMAYSLLPKVLPHDEANALTDKIMRGMGAHVDTDSTEKHSSFDFEGIHFENHKTFLNVNMFRSEDDAESYLHRHARPIYVALCRGKYGIDTADTDFYNVFLPLHFCHHYHAGHSLHQICDWAVMLRHGCGNLPEEISYPGIRHAYASLNALTIHLFGDILPEGSVPDLPTDTAMAEDMLLSAITPGYLDRCNPKNRNTLEVLRFKTRRMLYRARIRRQIFGRPVSMTVLHSILAHLRRPDTILV